MKPGQGSCVVRGGRRTDFYNVCGASSAFAALLNAPCFYVTTLIRMVICMHYTPAMQFM